MLRRLPNFKLIINPNVNRRHQCKYYSVEKYLGIKSSDIDIKSLKEGEEGGFFVLKRHLEEKTNINDEMYDEMKRIKYKKGKREIEREVIRIETGNRELCKWLRIQ